MRIDEVLARAREAATARMVFAEPYEKDGVTVIAAARIAGGGGGGTGQDRAGRRGDGGGLGLVAKPVGAFVIKDGDVHWRPAVDVDRLLATIGAAIVAGLFVGTRRKRK
jgi:uncharacterized spore protein YtfJ